MVYLTVSPGTGGGVVANGRPIAGVAKLGAMLCDPRIAPIRERTMPARGRDVPVVPAALGGQVG